MWIYCNKKVTLLLAHLQHILALCVALTTVYHDSELLCGSLLQLLLIMFTFVISIKTQVKGSLDRNLSVCLCVCVQ